MPSSLSYSVTVTGSTATFYVNNYDVNYQYQYQITAEDGTSILQYDYIFPNLVNGEYITDVTVFDPADGTSITISHTFTIAGSTVPDITLSIDNEPGFLHAVYNPVVLSLTKAPYRIGDLFFVEVWTVPAKDVQTQAVGNPKTGAMLLRTLRVNGTGAGTASVDVSSALASLFRSDNYAVPNLLLAIQKDETAYAGYFLKAGFIQYDARNREVKTYKFESDVKFVLRAALPVTTTGDMTSGYMYQYDGESVSYLTTIPDGTKRKPTETTFLSYFFGVQTDTTDIPQYIRLKADLEFTSGISEEGYVIGLYQLYTGGLYLLDAKPERLVAHPDYNLITKYSVYVEYSEDDSYSFPFTQSREFVIDNDIQEPVNVTFMNRLGSWDSIQFRRDRQTDIKTKANNFQNGFGTRVYQIDTQTSITYNSGWLTTAEHQYLKDLMVSPALYIDGAYYRQADTTYKIDSTLGLFMIELTVAPDTEENTIQL